MCHVSRLTNDQRIAYEGWNRKWQTRFEDEMGELTYPELTRKTRELFARLEAEMGKSSERIAVVLEGAVA